MLEREIKLRFASADLARQAILAPHVGATRHRARRLQDDSLLDTDDGQLLQRGSALRVRREAGASLLTFKGPAQAGAMKLREEHETAVAEDTTLLTILRELGFGPRFRYQKYREEFRAADVVIAIDETPIGVFVELEGSEERIHRTAEALGKAPTDYVNASYRSLYLDYCRDHGLAPTDMTFE